MSTREREGVRGSASARECEGAEDRMAQYSTRRFHMVSTLCATSFHHELELIPHETYSTRIKELLIPREALTAKLIGILRKVFSMICTIWSPILFKGLEIFRAKNLISIKKIFQ